MTLEGKKPGRQRAAFLCTRVVRGGPSEKETSAEHDEGIPRQRERPAQRPQAGLRLAQRDSEEADVAVAEQSRGGGAREVGPGVAGLLDEGAEVVVAAPRCTRKGRSTTGPSMWLVHAHVPEISGWQTLIEYLLCARRRSRQQGSAGNKTVLCERQHTMFGCEKKKMKKTKAGEGARKG